MYLLELCSIQARKTTSRGKNQNLAKILFGLLESIPSERLWLCVNRIAIIKPSYSHKEGTTVCCGGSSTMWKITAHLSTVSLADEWQRQEKLVLSQLCDALWIRSVSAGHTKKLRNERTAMLRNEGFRWWNGAGVNHHYHPEIWCRASGPPSCYSNTFFMSHPIFHVAETPGKRFGEQQQCWSRRFVTRHSW